MEDKEIINLYFSRSESAISETAKKYGTYCLRIANNILHNSEDSEECVNDTYMRAWNAIPPRRPNRLRTYLGKITRNLSLNKYETYQAQKRGAGEVTMALEELAECIPAQNSVEDEISNITLTELLNQFLGSLPEEPRKLFMRRYWYLHSTKEIAKDFGISEGKVRVSLSRSRSKLKEFLEQEGIAL